MKYLSRCVKFFAAIALMAILSGNLAKAADLPLAASSPITGISFDDRPLILPVQRNFQMAMLTAGSELGRSCGKMEAYGWRMGQSEQARVNGIFNSTVDRMRMMGYTITPQTISSVSNDITLFTADRSDKHFIFLWSAGELGLVMTLCETTAPLSPTYHPSPLVPSVQVFPVPADVVATQLPGKPVNRAINDNFSPVGEWTGVYTCHQGVTGGSLQINHLHGQNFDGTFKFYPTPKNPGIPAGSYNVYGQYDKDSKRILINPGKWIQRPHNYYDTVMVGSFDPIHDNFSAYFQGITGCTSFEAKREGEPHYLETGKKKPGKKKHTVKKKAVTKKVKPVAKPVSAVPAAAPVAPETSIPAAPPEKPADAGVPVPSTVPAAPAPPPGEPPASPPAVTPPSAPPPSSVGAPAAAPVTVATPPSGTVTVIPVNTSVSAPAPVSVGSPAPDAGITIPASPK